MGLQLSTPIFPCSLHHTLSHSVCLSPLCHNTHNTHIQTGRARRGAPVYQHRLEQDSTFQSFEGGGQHAEDDDAHASACNDFKADKVLGKKVDLFDINGIVTLQCRWADGRVYGPAHLPCG